MEKEPTSEVKTTSGQELMSPKDQFTNEVIEKIVEPGKQKQLLTMDVLEGKGDSVIELPDQMPTSVGGETLDANKKSTIRKIIERVLGSK
jgi:hypothetical protein